MRFRLNTPLAANPRMKNLFERAFFRRVAEYYGAKSLSIQVPGGQKNFGSKSPPNLIFHIRKINEDMRCIVSVEKFCRRNDLTQAPAKAGFTRGNSASDPDRRHLS